MEEKVKGPIISSYFLGKSDIVLAAGVILILAVMIVPLPSFMLDVLLAFNITFALIILLVVMYILQPLEFSIFPSILLIVTLFRLSLNVASTRLILLHGNEGIAAAGQVIKTFGSFVVGGNYVVGMIIFVILVIINFVVITKGTGRIAEVVARFTLDAMPGKQMSIDADLNAGLIDEEEARKRRAMVGEEADFYGAMDGASKFVRGDAIAGIIITLINIVGGLIIGVLQQSMSISAAARNYTLLTVGDGLVTQIPALIVSTAAGIVVTRASSRSDLGSSLSRQLLLHPRAIGIVAAILFLLALIPGLPKTTFIFLSILAGAGAYSIFRSREATALEEEEEEEKIQSDRSREPEKVEILLNVDVLGLEVGYRLIPLVDAEQNGELLERIKSIRRQIVLDMGIIVPPIHIRDNLQLKPDRYSILIKGTEVAGEELMTDHFLAMNAEIPEEKMKGIPTKEPSFGLPAWWITEQDKEKAQILGYTVVDISTVIATHLMETIKSHAAELLGRQDVQSLLDNLSEKYPKVVEELVPNLLTLGKVQKVLQNLLKEKVPIRDLLTIMEVLADFAPMTKDSDILTEYVRQGLARTITRQYRTEEGKIPLIVLDPKVEKVIQDATQHTDQGSYLALEPDIAQRILTQLDQILEKFIVHKYTPVILSSPLIRTQLRRLTERNFPALAILSPNEIEADTKIESLGTLSWQMITND